ncbi:MAG: hypothetical protein V9G29_06805 [Burkholderiaceae bacterium]
MEPQGREVGACFKAPGLEVGLREGARDRTGARPKPQGGVPVAWLWCH